MSWDGYITNLVQDGKLITEAAICCVESDKYGIWSSSPGLANISVEELKKLGGNRQDFAQNGVYIAGQRCRLLRDDMDTPNIYSMQLKTAADSNGDTFGVSVGKSEKAVVIVKGAKETNGGTLSNKVFGVVDYLRKNKL